MIQRFAMALVGLGLVACSNSAGPDDAAVVSKLSKDEMISFCEEMDAEEQGSLLTTKQVCTLVESYKGTTGKATCMSRVARCVDEATSHDAYGDEDQEDEDFVPCDARWRAIRRAFASCGSGDVTVGVARSCFREREERYRSARQDLTCDNVENVSSLELTPELNGPCAVLDCVDEVMGEFEYEDDYEDDDYDGSGGYVPNSHLECATDGAGHYTCFTFYE